MESHDAQLALHDRLWTWFEARKTQILWSTVLIVVAGFVAGFVVWRHQSREADANTALSTVMVTTNQAPAAPEALLQVAAEYAGTDAAARATLLAAGNLFAAGRYDEARTQFQRYLSEYGDRGFNGQALLGIASSLDAQGKANEAVAAYKEIIDRHPNDLVAPRARTALGRLYESQDMLKEARDLYQQVVREGGFNSVAMEAKMRLDALIENHPELAPAASQPMTPTAPPGLNLGNP